MVDIIRQVVVQGSCPPSMKGTAERTTGPGRVQEDGMTDISSTGDSLPNSYSWLYSVPRSLPCLFFVRMDFVKHRSEEIDDLRRRGERASSSRGRSERAHELDASQRSPSRLHRHVLGPILESANSIGYVRVSGFDDHVGPGLYLAQRPVEADFSFPSSPSCSRPVTVAVLGCSSTASRLLSASSLSSSSCSASASTRTFSSSSSACQALQHPTKPQFVGVRTPEERAKIPAWQLKREDAIMHEDIGTCNPHLLLTP
jgi:hypothetical protein